MERPNQKAVSNYTARLKKSDQLFDCLRVYVEVSQKYPDNDTNSLIIFFGVSYQAIGLGDFKFAADYEALVTSSGTIWKRRFDALNSWQRDEMLKPAIAEKKKIVTEKTGTIKVRGKEKPVTATEKSTVPNSPKVPADLEGPRPTEPVTDNQRQFVAAYKRFMDNTSEKPAGLTEKIFKMSGPQLVECVAAYLRASTAYDDKDERSLYIFYGTASLAIRRSDAYYSFRFASGIKTKGTLIAKRFDALNSTQRADLSKDIAIMKKRARILDDLKIEYFEREQKEPTLQTLRSYEFVEKSDQFAAFSGALDDLNRVFSVGQPDDLSTRFEALHAVVFANTEPLLFATLLKHCREVKTAAATVRHQVYWFMVGALYLQALKVRPEAYKDGFKDEEIQFLFDTGDTADPYFADFSIRLQYLWKHTANVADYLKACKGYLGLLQFANKIGAALVPMVEMSIVRGIVDKLQETKPQVIEKIRIPVNSRYDAGKTVKIYQTIGKVFILWYDVKLGAYVEHEGVEGVLFRVRQLQLARTGLRQRRHLRRDLPADRVHSGLHSVSLRAPRIPARPRDRRHHRPRQVDRDQSRHREGGGRVGAEFHRCAACASGRRTDCAPRIAGAGELCRVPSRYRDSGKRARSGREIDRRTRQPEPSSGPYPVRREGRD